MQRARKAGPVLKGKRIRSNPKVSHGYWISKRLSKTSKRLWCAHAPSDPARVAEVSTKNFRAAFKKRVSRSVRIEIYKA